MTDFFFGCAFFFSRGWYTVGFLFSFAGLFGKKILVKGDGWGGVGADRREFFFPFVYFFMLLE